MTPRERRARPIKVKTHNKGTTHVPAPQKSVYPPLLATLPRYVNPNKDINAQGDPIVAVPPPKIPNPK